MDINTAKYKTKDTVELLKDILDQENLTAKAVWIHSMGSLAILKDLPAKGIFILWVQRRLS
jgi:hypothetical protein